MRIFIAALLACGFMAVAHWRSCGDVEQPAFRPRAVIAANQTALQQGADNKGTGADKRRKPKFTIAKETTFVTGPVDKEGYIDYIAALNERLRKGVTPENNVVVLLWKALGPHPQG